MKYIAHRGIYNKKYKENTKEEIINTLSIKEISGVEFDIRKTLDNKFILYHDMLIKIKNKYEKVSNTTLKNIKEEYNITTLEELLNNINTNKILLIEIKEETNNFDVTIDKLLKILKKYKSLNIYLCSFNYNLIKKIKNNSKYKCGLIVGYLQNITKISNLFDFYLYSYNNINLINYSKEIFIFTINSKQKLNSIKIKKEYYIISDNIKLFIN